MRLGLGLQKLGGSKNATSPLVNKFNCSVSGLKVVLCIFRGPYGPIWGGGAPRATAHRAHPGLSGLGRELVGCVGGDALRVSRKRDDPLRASWHTLVPSAEVVRDASRQRTGYGSGYRCAYSGCRPKSGKGLDLEYG